MAISEVNLGGRPSGAPAHPMNVWLEGGDLKAYRFAPRIRDLQGRKLSHQRLYQYIAGQRAIPKEMAQRFKYISRGKVPISCWRLMLDGDQYFYHGAKITKAQAATVRMRLALS